MRNVRVLSPSETAQTLPALRELADVGVTADHNEQFSDQTWVDLRAGNAGLLVGHDEEANLVAASAVILGDTVTIEMLVHPEHRATGWGNALAQATADLVAEHRARNTVSDITAWTHGDHPASRVLAERHGLHPVRELYRMGLAPGDDFPVEVSEGYTIRTFVPGTDDAAWLKLNAAAFADHPEQGKLTQDDLDARKAEDWFSAEGFFIADNAQGEMAGFHWTKYPPHSGAGEVYAVGVDPSTQGTGLGRALTAHGINHLKSLDGVKRIVLYVDDANQPAVSLYRSMGFEIDNTDVMFSSTQ